MNAQEAAQLWDDIRSGFVNTEALIIRAIRERAWEPLGYTSFTACWDDRMAGVRLATDDVKKYVICALLDDGATTEEIVKSARVGDRIVETVRYQRDVVGINDPSLLSLRARPGTIDQYNRRTPPSEARRIHVDLGFEDYKKFTAIASELRVAHVDLAQKVLRDYIKAQGSVN